MKFNGLSGLIGILILSLPVISGQARTPAHYDDPLSGKLAQLRIYDRTAGHSLPVYWHQGKAYVVGNPGNEYEISLANRTSDDLLAVISVDGINVISGETASSQQRGYMFRGSDRYSIRGWRKTTEQTAAFYFTSLPDSYAARTKRSNNIGVIGVALFQRKPEPVAREIGGHAHEKPRMPLETAPPLGAETDSMSDDSASDQAREPSSYKPRSVPPYPLQPKRLGTGHGRIEDSKVEYVEFKRATRQPAEILTLHYDSQANLAARGVIPNPSSNGCAYNPKSVGCGRPFPKDTPIGFVPDPPR